MKFHVQSCFDFKTWTCRDLSFDHKSNFEEIFGTFWSFLTKKFKIIDLKLNCDRGCQCLIQKCDKIDFFKKSKILKKLSFWVVSWFWMCTHCYICVTITTTHIPVCYIVYTNVYIVYTCDFYLTSQNRTKRVHRFQNRNFIGFWKLACESECNKIELLKTLKCQIDDKKRTTFSVALYGQTSFRGRRISWLFR